MKNVLVLCTGNSCRSVMAEALINQLGQGHYSAMSAGSFPAGYVHPKSIATLKRHGIDPGEPRSKSWDEFADKHLDLVITVCDQAANETCPVFLNETEKLHWSTPTPPAPKAVKKTSTRHSMMPFSYSKAGSKTNCYEHG